MLWDVCRMWNGNSNRLSNSSLETIPEEGNDLPRISGLIPKSPETRKKEQEYLQLYESQKQHIDTFLEMLMVQRNLKRICTNERYLVGNYADYDNVNRSHSTSPTMTWEHYRNGSLNYTRRKKKQITENCNHRITKYLHGDKLHEICVKYAWNKHSNTYYLVCGCMTRQSWQIWCRFK